jgi:hypothetical protein
MRIWVDPGVDGFHRPFADIPNEKAKRSERWKRHVRRFPSYTQQGDPTFHRKPDSGKVREFVFSILTKCAEFSPAAITVPQLPIIDGGSRNKINGVLAAATAEWRREKGFRGLLILPAIFTNQRQLNGKTERKSKRKTINSCYSKSEANGLWAVDSSLEDQEGSSTFRNKRFPGLVDFHEEMANELPANSITIVGPYWGMNLVLWAKGLCRFPAIGVGGGYRYHIAGGLQRQPKIRLALPPLRRWARVGGPFRTWLAETLQQISTDDPAYADLSYVRDNYAALSTREASREQIARFYKKWYDDIDAAPAAGRALALYQMLSSAYVQGRALGPLPLETTARRPERVAEYLMLNCL